MDPLVLVGVLTEHQWLENLEPENSYNIPDGHFDQMMEARQEANPFPDKDFRDDPALKCWYPDGALFEEMKSLVIAAQPDEDLDVIQQIQFTFNRSPSSVEEAADAVRTCKAVLP